MSYLKCNFYNIVSVSTRFVKVNNVILFLFDRKMDTSNSVIYSTKSKDFTRIQDIEVKLDASNNRLPLPDKFKDHIEDTWQKRLATNLRLFNGTKFRLDTVEEVNGKLRLNLGITCYKDFQVRLKFTFVNRDS